MRHHHHNRITSTYAFFQRTLILTHPRIVYDDVRAKLYREVARLQAHTRDRDKLAAWIKTLPGADSRFYATLGVAEQLLQPR